MWRWRHTKGCFADLTAACSRVIDDHRQGLDWLQTWWEDEFRQPSVGNPLWEDQPLMLHYETWLRRELRRRDLAKERSLHVGPDGKLSDEIRVVDRIELQLSGNELADARQRRLALGLPMTAPKG